jgi:hypothetical protein
MSYKVSPMKYVVVTTASGAGVLVSSEPAVFYGLTISPKTTGIVQLAVYDATATAQGSCIFTYRVASTAGAGSSIMAHPIACRTGVYVSAILMTTAADLAVALIGTN